MLLKLSIHHYALIDHIEWDCSEGWTVLTGETGSGKSILLGALGLVLGGRAEGLQSIQQEKCIVEAEFRPSPAVRALLGALDEGGDCIIRRSIAPGGRSRAYVNDEPVKLQFLKTLAPMLVDLHGQEDGQRLHGSEGLLHAVDSFSAEAAQAAALWRTQHGLWTQANDALEQLKQERALPEADADYLRFQIEELEQIDFNDDRLRNLDSLLNALGHAQDIRQALESVRHQLQEDDRSVVGELRRIEQLLERVSTVHPASATLLERIRSSRIELDDAGTEAGTEADAVDLDPKALSRAEAERDRLNRMFDKHRVADLDALALRLTAMQEQLHGAQRREQRLAELQVAVDGHRAVLDATGLELSRLRGESGTALCHAIVERLQHLKMPAARLAFNWTPAAAPEAAGPERVHLTFSANPGQPLQPLNKVASGGERSRVMLSLKAAMTAHLEVPTLILDEIDAGVSGDVASRMADLIAVISKGIQVITISHLPQVAGKADHHFRVFKEERDGRANTGMTALDDAGRVEELAAMLSGETVGDTARAQARALMG